MEVGSLFHQYERDWQNGYLQRNKSICHETKKGEEEMSQKTQVYTKGSAISKDGTTIGYRQMGSGPGVVILHGGGLASQHFMKLGTALSDAFTVSIPDRRGRGMSGPFGNEYSHQKEDEDLDALLKKTGAHFVFGTAGVAGLHAAISLPALEKVAVFEPVIFLNQPGQKKFESMVEGFDKQMVKGDLVGGMVSLTKASQVSQVISAIPDFFLRPLFNLLLWIDERRTKGDNVSLRALLPTLHVELLHERETAGTLENYRNVSAEVLLLLGGKTSDPMIRETARALNTVLPHAHLVELPGLVHGTAQDAGKPLIFAEVLKRFFQGKEASLQEEQPSSRG
jgi:pimeloyl-ACP methyl ester carboxylesterase